MTRAISWEVHLAECNKVAKPGITVLGYVGEWQSVTKTKLICHCAVHGEWRSTNVSKFKNGRSCPQCGKLSLGASQAIGWKESKLRIEKILPPGYKLLGFVAPWSGSKTGIEISCPVHGFQRPINLDKVLAGRFCSCCGREVRHRKKRIDRQVIEKEINNRFSGTIYSFEGFQGEYIGLKSKTIVYCSKHDSRELHTVSAIRVGSKCSICRGVSQRQAYISIVGEDDSYHHIKFGIAQDAVIRHKQQQQTANRYTNTRIRIDSIFTFPSIKACKDAERAVLRSLPCGSVSKEVLPDGYTETLPIIYIGAVTRVYEEFGGVRMKPKLKKSIKNQMNY